MTIKLYEQNTHKTSTRRLVASDWLKLDKTYFVSIENWTLQKASPSSKIVWVNETIQEFGNSNTKEAVYIPKNAERLYEVDIDWVWVTKESVWKFFKLKDSSNVDGTTADIDEGQLELIKYISEKKSIFKIS